MPGIYKKIDLNSLQKNLILEDWYSVEKIGHVLKFDAKNWSHKWLFAPENLGLYLSPFVWKLCVPAVEW